MKNNLIRPIGVFLTLTGLLFTTSGFAIEKESLLEKGLRLYSDDSFEEALVMFLQAHQNIVGSIPANQGAIGAEMLMDEVKESVHELDEIDRLLGLSYFQLVRYTEAKPFLTKVLPSFPNDESVHYALGVINYALGEYQKALDHVKIIKQTIGFQIRVRQLEGQVYAALGKDDKAIWAFNKAVQINPEAVRVVAVELAQAYSRTGQFEKAQLLLEDATQKQPDAYEAPQWELLMGQLSQVEKPFYAWANYGLEYDTNVGLLPKNVEILSDVSKDSEIRHSFSADILQRHNLRKDIALYQEGHIYQNIHHRESEYNKTRLDYIFSPAWSSQNSGVRLPLELELNLLKGEFYNAGFSIAPGAYSKLSDEITLYAFYRYSSLSYFDDADDGIQDRSGSNNDLGFLFLWYLNNRKGEFRTLIEREGVDAGENWDRTNTRVYFNMHYQFTPKIKAGAGYLYNKEEYTNLNQPILLKQNDSGHSLYGSFFYNVRKNLELSTQLSYVNWNSNIELFSYKRSVILFGVNWQY